ncbi:MAG: glycosyltransferase family 39 protein, partial [Gemmatimonadales bacterium]
GLGIIATSILILGLVGGLQAPTLALLLLLYILVARKEVGGLPRLAAPAIHYLKANRRGLLIFGVVSFSAVTLWMTVLATAPPTDWDSLMYHLRVPVQFLHEGRIYVPADNLLVWNVGLVHMLYLPLLALGSSAGPALLSVFMAVLLGLAVFAFTARFLGDRTASLSLALLWGTTTLLLVAITPRLDVTLAFYLFLAHYALVLALSSSSSRAQFYLAAVLLGAAIGIKYNAVPYILGLVPLIVWVVGSQTRSVTASLRPLALFGLLVVAAALPWLVKNWILLHAPLYPLLAETALEPWLIPFYGSGTVPPSVNPEIFQFIWHLRVPFDFRALFLSPEELTIELEGAFYYANPILLLLLFWVFFLRNRTLNWLVIPAVGYVLVLLLAYPGSNLRYLIPAVVPLTIVAVHIVVRSCERFLSTAAARLVLVLVAGLALVPSGSTMYTWISQTKAVGHLIGASSAEEYLDTHLDISVQAYASLVRFVNGEVPEGSRILMLFEARGYYFKPSVVEDVKVTNWPLLAPQLAPTDCLAEAGFSHVLVNVGAVDYYARGGLDLEVIQWAALQQFAQRCLAPIYRAPGFVLFVVK